MKNLLITIAHAFLYVVTAGALALFVTWGFEWTSQSRALPKCLTLVNTDSAAVAYPPDASQTKIVVTRCMVSYSYAFGWVGAGSVLFERGNAVMGYRVALFDGDNIFLEMHTDDSGKDRTIEIMKIEYSGQDSVIYIKRK